MVKKDKKSAGSASRISDPRFASFETDPRFRLPSKKSTKITIDKRFSRMLKDDEFIAAAKVDRYGRKIKSDSKKKALQRLYQEEDNEENDDDDDKEDEEEEDDIEVDDDEIVQRELRKAHEKYDPARGGGFSSSEDDSDSDSDDDEDEEEDTESAVAGDMQQFQDEQADAEAGEVTNRIAIVNLDWDHIKSTDLMALFSSFLSAEAGKVEKISIYPSEFGKERMQQEEVDGPPKELFKNNAKDDDSDADSDEDSDDDDDEKIKRELMQEGDDEDFDSDALRKYQLDRLRYYYAVMICSSASAAQKIYEATDGTEFQSSSNFLDLRFVPDDVTFDDEPRDECDRVPDSYKPVEFVTNALQSSKVKLTWDMHPEEVSRKDAVNRAFSGSRAEIEENDLRAYLASDTEDSASDDDNDDQEEEPAEEEALKLSKKELARKKMREALGLTDEPSAKASKGQPVGDMEITFTPALTETKSSKKDVQEETTIEKYKRKERERKEKKRQAHKAKREGRDPDGDDNDDNTAAAAGEEEVEDLGFDDPFFTTDGATSAAGPSKTSIRKEERRKKREEREAADAQSAAEKARLAAIMAADASESKLAKHLEHFDMNDILKAEKAARKKGKGKSKKHNSSGGDVGELQKGFNMDVKDERFQAVFENHEFAIDPSNPKFKATQGMNKLLEEGRKKRRGGGDDEEERGRKKVKKGRR